LVLAAVFVGVAPARRLRFMQFIRTGATRGSTSLYTPPHY